MRHINIVREFKHEPCFTINDIKRVTKDTKITKNYLWQLMHYLIKKGEVHKITKGVYTFRDDIVVVGFAYSPFYYGLQEALSLRNLWEQETNPIIITTRKVREGMRTFLGRNYLVKRIPRKLFFGFELVKYYDIWIPVSTAEKTLLDFLYFEIRLSDETLASLLSAIDKEKFLKMSKKFPKRVQEKVKDICKRSLQ